jgi:hypothetical protein
MHACQQCDQPLVEYLLDYGIGLVCPLCKQVGHVADFVANSPAFPPQFRNEAQDVGAVARGLGLTLLLLTGLNLFD